MFSRKVVSFNLDVISAKKPITNLLKAINTLDVNDQAKFDSLYEEMKEYGFPFTRSALKRVISTGDIKSDDHPVQQLLRSLAPAKPKVDKPKKGSSGAIERPQPSDQKLLPREITMNTILKIVLKFCDNSCTSLINKAKASYINEPSKDYFTSPPLLTASRILKLALKEKKLLSFLENILKDYSNNRELQDIITFVKQNKEIIYSWGEMEPKGDPYYCFNADEMKIIQNVSLSSSLSSIFGNVMDIEAISLIIGIDIDISENGRTRVDNLIREAIRVGKIKKVIRYIREVYPFNPELKSLEALVENSRLSSDI
ncbi:hypothetical protein A2230_01060 [candidate division WOR-1 bacterium RIFOXYA2_FULL_36_21]|uniref:Uncharacterized protein n=1 Tax=candidate division WOR-1 bacterium RIFOXYB2_FULL_36_35 TaxID=1802578 RepID=A0A1F4S4B0_UNCSA|nr:MAG: hypothetical protein A2230_01060 [candidate division WOR-1 bacterium RIFOXYA2_FULL_36_21]OGC14270.1 MAG: hypothetical protein A2282_06775 [candidate division WOR-1 bacterium RIFOXYA12_FULL_36_13]OGC15275.1 MAG: hypothetical protein A2290_03270 [candidate division WOR-1 bacterium RIFOXYB2_FULL_36_35]